MENNEVVMEEFETQKGVMHLVSTSGSLRMGF